MILLQIFAHAMKALSCNVQKFVAIEYLKFDISIEFELQWKNC